MKALILCGGPATRLREHAGEFPKALLPVGNKPFVAYLFDQIRSAGLSEVILATGHLHDRIEEAVGSGEAFGVSVRYSRESRPLGTGGAVRLALDLLDDVFLVMNGDSFLDFDLSEFVSAQAGGERPAMVLTEVTERGRYGTVTVEDGLVTGFREKDETSGGLINAGIYILRKADFADVEAGRMVSLEEDLFPRWAPNVAAFVARGYFVDIGTPESYAAVREGFPDAR
ncbi:MAG: hypothetical protein AMK75_04890 [Planctomycetes bacterium SM23_65]|nr:MAG: hypothetical protein AMK75_04890 [Planctomycetes bacterium SM23_65]